MLKRVFTDIIGSAIVAAGRAIKIKHLGLYSQNNFDITPEQYAVLNILRGGDYCQNRLCDLLFKDKSNMTRLISVLVTKNLVERKKITENGKQINKISLTEKGDKLRMKITPVMETSRKNYLKDISEDDMYVCIKVLTQIQKNLEEE